MRIKDKHRLNTRRGAGAERAVTDLRTVRFCLYAACAGAILVCGVARGRRLRSPPPILPQLAALARLPSAFCNVSGMHCFLSVFFLTPLQTTSGCFRNLGSEGGWLSVSLMFKTK